MALGKLMDPIANRLGSSWTLSAAATKLRRIRLVERRAIQARFLIFGFSIYVTCPGLEFWSRSFPFFVENFTNVLFSGKIAATHCIFRITVLRKSWKFDVNFTNDSEILKKLDILWKSWALPWKFTKILKKLEIRQLFGISAVRKLCSSERAQKIAREWATGR